MATCSVCAEDNITKSKQVICPSCDFLSCKECTSKYLLNSFQDPHCMSCRVTWNKEILSTLFTKKFIFGELKDHRENVLLDRELSMLPVTQPYVQEAIDNEKRHNQLIEIQQQIKNLKLQIRNLESEALNIRYPVHLHSRERIVSTRKCPLENCKGFLSSQWICGICDNKICKDCNEKKDENHKCDPELVETMKQINEDSKPCPSCGTRISKVSGCNQMWCPNCKNAFCYRTGKIETGTIHNPHYYQWMRNNGGIPRNPGDVLCGGMPSLFQLGLYARFPANHYNRQRINNQNDRNPIKEAVSDLHRYVQHIRVVVLPRYTVYNVTDETNRDIRIQYMRNIINEEKLKFELQKREKARSKKIEHHQILDMFVNVVTTEFLNICPAANQTVSIEEWQNFLNKTNTLKTFTDEAFKKIAKIYSSKSLLINEF